MHTLTIRAASIIGNIPLPDRDLNISNDRRESAHHVCSSVPVECKGSVVGARKS